MTGTSDATADDTEMTVDFLDDDDFSEDDDSGTPVVLKASNCDLRRKIEERLERRRLCEELGIADIDLRY